MAPLEWRVNEATLAYASRFKWKLAEQVPKPPNILVRSIDRTTVRHSNGGDLPIRLEVATRGPIGTQQGYYCFMGSSVGEQGYDSLAAVPSPDLGGVSSKESGFRTTRSVVLILGKAETTECVSLTGRIAADSRHAPLLPLRSSREVICQCPKRVGL